MTIGIFRLYFFRTRLNEPCIANVLLQSLQGYLSVIQSFFAFLISQGTISNILGAREDMLSIPKYTVWFLCLCRVESFLRLYGFVQNEKYLS